MPLNLFLIQARLKSGNRMTFDAYSLKARIAPAFISVILPIMVFNHFYTSAAFARFVSDVLALKIAVNISISLVLLVFAAEVGRFISKNVFERLYFKQELWMPTTNFLLFSDRTYSDDYKLKLHKKIYSDFKVKLKTEAEEVQNELLARTKIVETMALIRKKLHGNKFLLQHNIEYGAMRNLVGGSLLGLILSLVNILFFKYASSVSMAVNISIITAILYSIILVLSRFIFDFYGVNYAKVLFREYCGK